MTTVSSLKRSSARRQQYSAAKAGAFWTRRLASTDSLAAVLTYDAPAAVNAAYDRWECAALSAAVGKSLHRKSAVDIGAGTGRISLLLATKGAQVTSVDIAEGMLGQLMSSARQKRLQKAITPILASAARLPLSDRSADLVTCCGLLEHLPAAVRARALSETFRILKPRGKLIVVVNNTECVFHSHQYPMTSQRPDGYFVGLVGLPWLMAKIKRAGLIARIRAANPHYACAYFLARQSEESGSGLTKLLSRLTRLDLQTDPESTQVRCLASHYLVEVVQR